MKTGACRHRAVSPAAITRNSGITTNRTAISAARTRAAWATGLRHRSALRSRQRIAGRIVINVQTDGDLNYAPGVLWTAVHHKLPMLTIMHNNRAWHQELMFVEYMTGVRGRGTDRGHIGNVLRDPFIDYTKMAEGYGMKGEGPISDPKLLAAHSSAAWTR